MKLCQQKDTLSIIESVGSEADDFSLEMGMEELCDNEEGSVDIPSKNLTEGVPVVNKRIEAEKEKTKIAMMLEENNIDGNLDVESIVSLILQHDCYGGGNEKLGEIDRKLHEKGFGNDFGEAFYVHYEASLPHGEGILSELADQRFLKEKQRGIDAALGHLESFPLCIVDNGGSAEETDETRYSETCGIDFISISSTYKPLTSSDIRLMVKDAEVELEGLTLLYRDDVRRLVTEIMTSFVDCVTQ